jgi:UDP:flavonoid glycosyltransferase YjiC (YdhE family)
VRVTLLTAGSRGDVEPYVALGAGLRRAGHDVRLATHPGFADLAARHGLDLVPVPQPPPALTGSRTWQRWQRSGTGTLGFVRGFARVADAGRGVIDGMLDAFWAATEGADIVLSSSSALAGPQLADARGARHCWALLQPATPTGTAPHFLTPAAPPLPAAGNRATYRVAEQAYWRLFRRPVDDWLGRRLGQPPSRGPHPRGFLGTDPDPVLYGISPLVVPRPPDWGPAITLCGFWFADPPSWTPPAGLAGFLDSGPPPVYVQLSRIAVRSRRDLLRAVLAALAGLRLRGLLGTGLEPPDVELPETVYAVGSAPHSVLLPRTAAVVHHGGAGTAAAALRAGVPSLGVPGFYDQPYWSRRVAALGAGPAPVPAAKLNAGRLTAALARLTADPRLAERARVVGAAIGAEAGVRCAVQRLERRAEAGR